MSLQCFYFYVVCFVCILYRIVYRSKAVLFCENSNLRENKPCMVQTVNVSRQCQYIGVKWMEPVTSRYPVNVAFVFHVFTQHRLETLSCTHQPCLNGLWYYCTRIQSFTHYYTSAIKSWFWIKDRECENLTFKFLKEKAFTVLCNKKLLQCRSEKILLPLCFSNVVQ